MKQPAGKVEPTTPSSQEPTREELEAEFRLDDAGMYKTRTYDFMLISNIQSM